MYFKNKNAKPFLSNKNYPEYCRYLLLDLSDKDEPVAISTNGALLVIIPIVIEDDDFTDFEENFPVFLTWQMVDAADNKKNKHYQICKDGIRAGGILFPHLISTTNEEVFFPNYNDKEGLLNVPGDFCFNLQIPFKQIYKMFRAYGKLPKEATMQVFSKGYPDGTVKDHFRLYNDDDEFIGIGMMDLDIMKHYEKMDESLQDEDLKKPQ